MGNIIKFNPNKKAVTAEYRRLLEIILNVAPEQVEGFLIYVKFTGQEEAMTCYKPTWEMTGKVRGFTGEIQDEMYGQAFGEELVDEVDD